MANLDVVTRFDLRPIWCDLLHFLIQRYKYMSLSRCEFLIPGLTCRRAVCNNDTK